MLRQKSKIVRSWHQPSKSRKKLHQQKISPLPCSIHAVWPNPCSHEKTWPCGSRCRCETLRDQAGMAGTQRAVSMSHVSEMPKCPTAQSKLWKSPDLCSNCEAVKESRNQGIKEPLRRALLVSASCISISPKLTGRTTWQRCFQALVLGSGPLLFSFGMPFV